MNQLQQPEEQSPVRFAAVGELEIVYKKGSRMRQERITNPKEAAEFLFRLYGESRFVSERFYVVFLNNAKKTIGYNLVSMGGVTAAIVDPAKVFYPAMRVNANGIILAHNHPSGSTHPSQADLQLTRRLCEAGKLLDIEIVDHIIIGDQDYLSLREGGHM